MLNPNSSINFLSAIRTSFLTTLLIAVFVLSAFPQAGTSSLEAVNSGALIIAMDNAKQGNDAGCAGLPFNIRAYGLAVRLLHNNIPVKWAIANKANKDDVDFVADATRITGQNCQNGGANTSFSGGPLIIPSEYAAQALTLINAFNSESDMGGTDNDVRVYQVNAGFNAMIRYTLAHKPLIAVGPDGGNFGTNVHNTLFTSAKLKAANGTAYFAAVSNSTINTSSCYTIATQAHASADAIDYIDEYRNFALSGGNLLLQCKSVDVFENNINFGLFQSTTGWNIFGTNDNTQVASTLTYPNPAMAYNQFVGTLADEDGAVTEYSLKTGGFYQNGTLIAARNSGSSANNLKNVATVSRIGSSSAGGNVFELGGHDYLRQYSTNTPREQYNGLRMILNSLLVPATRQGCGLTIPKVVGHKVVRMSTDLNTDGFPNVGDTVEWTLNYINDSTVDVSNFQVNDPIATGLTYVSPLVVTATAGSTATANAGYNGVGNANMLNPVGYLKAGGRITIKVKTLVTTTGIFLNQGTATGSGIASSGVKTDTADNTTPGTVQGYNIGCSGTNPGSCLSQALYQTTGTDDPTGIDLTIITAAGVSIDGQVRSADGRGIGRVTVSVTHPSSGEVRTTITNPYGHFSIEDLPAGEFYVVSVSSKTHQFSTPSYAFTLLDSVSGLTFIADGGVSTPPIIVDTGRRTAVPSPSRKPSIRRNR
ncbi:MAG: carboxypeptidase regulatory-like domain-containing protein [Pyrinomonadaceae bacterium]|nr:carboxypeptidase regulatory-like domain-containing protein [Pyrinomonadaceae bacterium]MBP6212796.1 carboxypeptidase regulatory-like domain-containing protein [Pyrinomonadaceae bacterium]